MKTDTRVDSDKEDINKSFGMDLETVYDIIERINGLSFEGQRQIYAYLKTQIEKHGNGEEWKKRRHNT